MLSFLVVFMLTNNISNLANEVEVSESTSFESTVEEINNTLAINKNEYLDSITKAQVETAKYKASVGQIINAALDKQTSVTEDKNVGVIDKWLNSYRGIKEETKRSKSKEGLYIFISFSMPKATLENLDKAARKIGARLVIRGLKNNSFKETLRFIKEVKREGIIIDIDPESFKQFGVNLAPTFVVSDGLKYDKVVGNISVRYVLNKFIAEGDLPVLSKEYLKRLGNDA